MAITLRSFSDCPVPLLPYKAVVYPKKAVRALRRPRESSVASIWCGQYQANTDVEPENQRGGRREQHRIWLWWPEQKGRITCHRSSTAAVQELATARIASANEKLAKSCTTPSVQELATARIASASEELAKPGTTLSVQKFAEPCATSAGQKFAKSRTTCSDRERSTRCDTPGK
ncbi:hypothetical protein LTR53_002550 [Teratosphaeriaceae sp. CCFEE 6253]|nr:hypothetical protein LTR53_002550 [Teratosphaeriaceae sp. CCFEE 6253]